MMDGDSVKVVAADVQKAVVIGIIGGISDKAVIFVMDPVL
jgi:hypothetical protein